MFQAERKGQCLPDVLRLINDYPLFWNLFSLSSVPKKSCVLCGTNFFPGAVLPPSQMVLFYLILIILTTGILLYMYSEVKYLALGILKPIWDLCLWFSGSAVIMSRVLMLKFYVSVPQSFQKKNPFHRWRREVFGRDAPPYSLFSSSFIPNTGRSGSSSWGFFHTPPHHYPWSVRGWFP